MIVLLGSHSPHSSITTHNEPCEYTWNDRGAGYSHVVDGRPNGRDALLHVLANDVTQLPGQECFLSIVRDWSSHSAKPPTYVEAQDSERPDAAADLAVMLSEAYNIPVGRPDDVEDTHHTAAGPPGTGPDSPVEG